MHSITFVTHSYTLIYIYLAFLKCTTFTYITGGGIHSLACTTSTCSHIHLHSQLLHSSHSLYIHSTFFQCKHLVAFLTATYISLHSSDCTFVCISYGGGHFLTCLLMHVKCARSAVECVFLYMNAHRERMHIQSVSMHLHLWMPVLHTNARRRSECTSPVNVSQCVVNVCPWVVMYGCQNALLFVGMRTLRMYSNARRRSECEFSGMHIPCSNVRRRLECGAVRNV